MAANVVKLDHMQMRKIEDGLDNIAKALNRIAKAMEPKQMSEHEFNTLIDRQIAYFSHLANSTKVEGEPNGPA